MSTDLTVPQSAEVAALIASQEDEFEGISFQTPILKVCQALTREVQDDKAEAGDFLNTLTSESLGDRIEFIVSYFSRGRSASDPKTSRYYVTDDFDVIPERWADLVGEDYVGTPFAEYDEAEERYKERVNAKEIPWGKGPLISTTYNYTGFVIVHPLEGEEGEPDLQPVKLSLQRSNKAASDKILTLKRSVLRGKPFWANVFELSTRRRDFDRGTSYVVDAKLGRPTDAGEQAQATELALALGGGRVIDNAEQAEQAAAPVEPDAKGGAAF